MIITEISEAIESYRTNPFENNFGEELADAVIRIYDLAEKMGIDLQDKIDKKMKINEERPNKHNKYF